MGWDMFNHARCQGRALAARALAELAQGRAADALATVEERLQMSKEFSRDRSCRRLGRALIVTARCEAIEPDWLTYGAGSVLLPTASSQTRIVLVRTGLPRIGDKRGEWMVAEAKQKLAASPLKTHRALAAETTSPTKSAAVSK